MSRSELSAVAVGAALGAAVVILWKRSAAPPHMPATVTPRARPAEPPLRVAVTPVAEGDRQPTSSFLASELERLARVAVSHGRDDPAVDVFLAFVGALDPLPGAATLQPAADVIGELRLAQALDRPGELGVGASRLLAAASAAPAAAPPNDLSELLPAIGAHGTVTVARPSETGRRLPDLVEALLQAIRAGLSLLV